MVRKDKEYWEHIAHVKRMNRHNAVRRFKQIFSETGSSLLELKIILDRIKVNS